MAAVGQQRQVHLLVHFMMVSHYAVHWCQQTAAIAAFGAIHAGSAVEPAVIGGVGANVFEPASTNKLE